MSARELLSQPSEEQQTANALAEQYTNRHVAMEHYILILCIVFSFLRFIKIDPQSWKGLLAIFLSTVLMYLGIPIIITMIWGEWEVLFVQTLAIVSLGLASISVAVYRPFRHAIFDFLSLHRALIDIEGLQRLIIWDKRWYSITTSTPAAAAFATIIILFLLKRSSKMAIPLPINAMVISSMMLYQIGEIMYSVSLLSVESYILRSYRYKLYRLSPIDSIPIKMSIQGSNRLALLVGLLATVFIISFTILLWTQVRLVAPVALALLLSGYFTIAFGIVHPRLTMRRIIQEAKWREMNLLQQQLDTFLLRMPELTTSELETMQRLKQIHDMIRDSSENVLPISSLGKLASSLIMPTSTFVLTLLRQKPVITSLTDRLTL